jgi:hypothetical protein
LQRKGKVEATRMQKENGEEMRLVKEGGALRGREIAEVMQREGE